MIEFKQIIGRGTRLFDGKEYFTIIDFVDAYKHFSDPEWDGEPIDQTTDKATKYPFQSHALILADGDGEEYNAKPKKIKIKLRDGKEREIQHMISTSFWGADGKPISTEEFLNNMFGVLPDFFKSEEELRNIWSNPITRKALLEKMADAGYGKEELETLQRVVDAEDSDLFDVLSYISFAIQPITRTERVAETKGLIFQHLDGKQKEFLNFVLSKYIDEGVEELDEEKLPQLLNLKYQAITDAEKILGGVERIRSMFFNFQKNLYTNFI